MTVHLDGAGLKLLSKHVKLKVLFTVQSKSKKLVSKELTLKKASRKK